MVIRDLNLLVFDGAPISEWDGETFAQVMTRVEAYKSGDKSQARSDAERAELEKFPVRLETDADFMIHLLR